MRRTWALVGCTSMLLFTIGSCGGGGETDDLQEQQSESCMLCHNGSLIDDFSGPGIENPHPFGTAANLKCTTCHGGNPTGTDLATSHVPPPPEIGDEENQVHDAQAYFNRLTLAGIDKFPDYVVDGVTHTGLEFLQFVNPGDLRVTGAGHGCGACHANHAEDVGSSLLATATGFYSGATYHAGEQNLLPENAGLYEDTAADVGFRALTDPDHDPATAALGDVGHIVEARVYSKFGDLSPDAVFDNPEYFAAALVDDQNVDGTIVTDSPLAHLYREQVSVTCGDCHLGSAGANNRAADFRSSGCTACHMQYSLGGRSGSSDPNVNKFEPLDPDDIDAPERAHPRTHRIASIAKTLPDGTFVAGIDDYACVDCHQGSNRTVMQYWGIRLDQNADLVHHQQYPANPASFQTTHGDERLFDPLAGNHTFNGRNANQYIKLEDYDGDGRDDTPADVHYEAGMGCIDCHGSYDLHGGDASQPGSNISSRMEQQVAIRCESCHGGVDEYAPTKSGVGYDGQTKDLAYDAAGHVLKHVSRDANGDYYLISRLTGATHYIRQTRDVVADNGKLHPISGTPLYSAKASYAMGRVDADPSNGTGPEQSYGATPGFSHSDDLDCVACHGSWTNTCMGCHLSGEYDLGNNFSNVTGERIVYKQRTADFTYQSPVFFQLGVNARGKITQYSSNTKVFFRWEDKNGTLTKVYAFSDRDGKGNDPADSPFPALAHNALMSHAIRGKVGPTKEGPRYCVSCHLTADGMATYADEYDAFKTKLEARDYATLDYQQLKQHFGRNTGNQMDSPLFVHGVAGLGTGLFLFDENGCPVNPLDTNPDRKGCDGVVPANAYDPNHVLYDLDRIVEPSGASNASNNHAWVDPLHTGAHLRDGALDPQFAGPLGATLIRKLTDPLTGIILDSWIDASGALQGDAGAHVGGP
jgi:hypothetical protein